MFGCGIRAQGSKSLMRFANPYAAELPSCAVKCSPKRNRARIFGGVMAELREKKGPYIAGMLSVCQLQFVSTEGFTPFDCAQNCAHPAGT
jgi:hypothetical protein